MYVESAIHFWSGASAVNWWSRMLYAMASIRLAAVEAQESVHANLPAASQSGKEVRLCLNFPKLAATPYAVHLAGITSNPAGSRSDDGPGQLLLTRGGESSSTGAVRDRHPFTGSHLTWPFKRDSQRFRVRVVEPDNFSSADNDRILFAVVQELIEPVVPKLDRFDSSRRPSSANRYDLVTFPEAFATPSSLLAVANSLAGRGPSGCLHMGLKSGASPRTHLMTVAEIGTLVADLEALTDTSNDDLFGFKGWLDQQQKEHRFNIGCVLAVDADNHLRVCLHPKIVASKFEIDALAERHMQEADLLTLISLRPRNGRFVTVTLQPLICSDVLNIPTERMTGPPIMAITQYSECFDAAPDHVDIVSVATCTPQPRGRTAAGPYAQWHRQFLDAFLAAAENPGCKRHQHASIVLANYRKIGEDHAGLSGAFVPTASGFGRLHREIAISGFGKPADGSWANNAWSIPGPSSPDGFKDLGFVLSLDSSGQAGAAVARTIGFSLHHLPREAPAWGSTVSSIVEPEVTTWEKGDDEQIKPTALEPTDV